MADRQPLSRTLLLGGGGVLVLVLAVALRGSVALLAVASAAAVIGLLLSVVPLLRDDGIDWDWQPGRADEIPPEPGVGRLRLLLDPSPSDPHAGERLQDLVRAIASDRAARAGSPGEDSMATDESTALGRYLAGAPRRLDLAEAERVITELEGLAPRRTT